jgi:hypothetical protein
MSHIYKFKRIKTVGNDSQQITQKLQNSRNGQTPVPFVHLLAENVKEDFGISDSSTLDWSNVFDLGKDTINTVLMIKKKVNA